MPVCWYPPFSPLSGLTVSMVVRVDEVQAVLAQWATFILVLLAAVYWLLIRPRPSPPIARAVTSLTRAGASRVVMVALAQVTSLQWATLRSSVNAAGSAVR